VPVKGSKAISWRGELLRKLTHLGALIIPCSYCLLDLSRGQILAVMVPVAAAMIVIDIARLRDMRLWFLVRRLISPMIRETEALGDFTGATYILSTACLVIAFFAKPIAVLALTFIIVGDPAAAIIGIKYGRHRFKNKSLEGSLAFLAMALIAALIVHNIRPAVAIPGAVVAAFTEAVSFRVDDNATVPLVSGLFMTLLAKILASL
jgi:dolichol kinase